MDRGQRVGVRISKKKTGGRTPPRASHPRAAHTFAHSPTEHAPRHVDVERDRLPHDGRQRRGRGHVVFGRDTVAAHTRARAPALGREGAARVRVRWRRFASGAPVFLRSDKQNRKPNSYSLFRPGRRCPLSSPLSLCTLPPASKPPTMTAATLETPRCAMWGGEEGRRTLTHAARPLWPSGHPDAVATLRPPLASARASLPTSSEPVCKHSHGCTGCEGAQGRERVAHTKQRPSLFSSTALASRPPSRKATPPSRRARPRSCRKRTKYSTTRCR